MPNDPEAIEALKQNWRAEVQTSRVYRDLAERETDPKRTRQDDAIENAFHNDRSERSETVHAEQAARILGSEQFTDTTR
jgi:hypothetical protein